MPSENRDPHLRSSTDEGLATERRRTDDALAVTSDADLEAAALLVAQAREKADTVLNDARGREDLKVDASRSVTATRAREDAVLENQRMGADAAEAAEQERREIALAGLLAYERECTDLRLESERDRADQALTSREDVMAMVSHDLRSLLGGIALSAELVKGSFKMDDPVAAVTKYAERIQRFTARMNRLVGDLMDDASIEAGKLSLHRTRREVSALMRDACEAFEPAASSQGIALRCESSDDAGSIDVDAERVLQVLTNLVGNALKFTLAGGSIVIRAVRDSENVRFSVEDTGSGIPTDLLGKIFERYFQPGSTIRIGLGLGLFISKSIVEGHGGKIWAESVPGQGSTVSFTLPVTAPG